MAFRDSKGYDWRQAPAHETPGPEDPGGHGPLGPAARKCGRFQPGDLMQPADTNEVLIPGASDKEVIAIVGMQAREARELACAAESIGLAVHPVAFGSPLADAALAAHGPGSVRLPLAIVAGRYSLERPGLVAVLECLEVVRGTRQTLPEACVALAKDREHVTHPR